MITEMLDEGAPLADIALALGLARNTVEYHISRIQDGIDVVDEPPLPDLSATTQQVKTRDRVRVLLAQGYGRLEIARQLGVTKSTVSYHARRLGEPIDERCTRRYDWAAVQRFYAEGHSISDCQAAFGFSRQTWNAARQRGDVVSRPQAMPVEQLLAGKRNRTHLKRRLLSAGLLEDRCARCGIAKWRGRPLSLALHHVNGDRHDNRLENLELLCPNCHSQTENFSGRNRSFRPVVERA